MDFAPRPLWLQHAPWDRAGHTRLTASELDEALHSPAAWVADVSDQQVLLHDHTLARRPVTDTDRRESLLWAGRDTHGAPAWVRVHEEPHHQPGWLPWREATLLINDADAAVMSLGLALARWHRLSRFCGRCGSPNQVASGGWVLTCTGCQAELYPRTDPVVIMAVTDADDRLCLSRGHRWLSPVGVSCPAGFVDAGESLEDAVRREVHEELGLQVTDVGFAGSQPWPAVGQLMVAMTARVEDPTLRIDPAEVAFARWYTRDELRHDLSAGLATLPQTFAAGRWLVERWLGETLPDSVGTTYSRAPAAE